MNSSKNCNARLISKPNEFAAVIKTLAPQVMAEAYLQNLP